MDETIEREDGTFLSLESARIWPKYRITWAVRRRSGESDFPIAVGYVEAMPPADGNLQAMWTDLRSRALAESGASRRLVSEEREPKKSLFRRLFGSK